MADIQIRNFVQSTTVPLLPVLTAMQATSQLDRLRNSFLRGCRLSLWMVMYFVTCLVVFHDEVMRLVLQNAFEKYAASGTVLALLLAAYLSYLPRMMLLKVAFAQARVRSVILCNLASQLCNLGLTLYLVAVLQLGAVGAALSTLLIEVIWHLLFWGPLSAWLVDIPLWRYVRDGLVLGAAPAAACAIALEVLRRFVEPTGFVAVALCMVLGLAVYAAVLFYGCLTEADRADLRNVKATLVGRGSES